MTAHSLPVEPSSDRRKAVVAYLTSPAKGEYVINLGIGDHTVERWQISKVQLRRMVADGFKWVIRELEEGH